VGEGNRKAWRDASILEERPQIGAPEVGGERKQEQVTMTESSPKKTHSLLIGKDALKAHLARSNAQKTVTAGQERK